MSVSSLRISSLSPLLLIGSRMKKCHLSFDVLNCWLNMAASCFDDENELPFKVIASLSASTAWWHLSSGPRSQQNISILAFSMSRCGSGCHNSVLAIYARWGLFYRVHLVLSSHPISLLAQVPRRVCIVQYGCGVMLL